MNETNDFYKVYKEHLEALRKSADQEAKYKAIETQLNTASRAYGLYIQSMYTSLAMRVL